MKKPAPETRNCASCWHSMGTPAHVVNRHTTTRQCLATGLEVVVYGHDVASCSAWKARPSNAIIALRANLDAIDRVHPELQEDCQ